MAALKRSVASLIGGIAIGIFVLVLWLLLFGTGTVPLIVLGALVAIGLGTWIRLADL